MISRIDEVEISKLVEGRSLADGPEVTSTAQHAVVEYECRLLVIVDEDGVEGDSVDEGLGQHGLFIIEAWGLCEFNK